MTSDILKDVVIIFALSTFVNFIFTKIRIPTLVGYLLTWIVALRVNEQSILTGKTPAESGLRNKYGITLVAIKRENILIDHPSSNSRLLKGDIAYILGKPEQIANATNLFSNKQH